MVGVYCMKEESTFNFQKYAFFCVYKTFYYLYMFAFKLPLRQDRN